MLSKTNSIHRGPYIFKPTKYDKDDNLYCMIVKNNKCKLTGLYNFETKKFEIIYEVPGFMNHNHKKMLNWFLKQYDWI